MQHVAILAYDGFATFELGCAVELFALPRPEISDWYQAEVVTFEDGPLSATGGLQVHARKVTNLDDKDIVVIPSWPTTGVQPSAVMLEALGKFAREGKRLLSFCSGAFLLAELGLLNNRHATTHWRYASTFKSRYPEIQYVDNVLYVYQDNIGCSAGSAAAIDLGMEVIRQDFGYEVANQVARRLVMSPQRSGGQAQFVEAPLQKRTSTFSTTLDWALQHLDQAITVEDLAKRASMSRRSFDRHFRRSLDTTPLEWLTRQRLTRAQVLLESSTDGIDMVAQKAGFSNALTLRLNFKKYLGISPQQHRQQFSQGKQFNT